LFFPKENRRDFPEETSDFQDKRTPGFFQSTIEKNRVQRYTVKGNCSQRYTVKGNCSQRYTVKENCAQRYPEKEN